MKDSIVSLTAEHQKRKPRTPAEIARANQRLFLSRVPKDLVEPELLASGGDMSKILEQADDDEETK